MALVRLANPSDASSILAIYAPFVLNTAISFETDIPSVSEFALRIEKGLHRFPWIVCESEGIVAGYAYASPYRERAAYQWSCECSVYLHEQYRGRRIGEELYAVLFHILKLQGMKTVYAGITLPNEASEHLHARCGFEQFALYENVGYKLNAWQKVGWWRLTLGDYERKPAPPVYFSKMDHHLLPALFNSASERIRSRMAT
jgi:phosphinothricin acetyltransferase